MDVTAKRRNDEQDDLYRRALRRGLLASLLVHLLLFLIFSLGRSVLLPTVAEGPREGDDRPAGGALRAMSLRIPPPVPIVRPPEPLLPPELEIDLDEIVLEDIPLVQVDLEGLRGLLPGRGDDTGRGAGGDGPEGPLRTLPPVPRGLILAPDGAPRELRGRSVEVRVYVNEQGRVVRDSTKLLPPSGDARYNDELKRQAAQWVFEPARRGTQLVSAWFSYVLTFH